MSSGSEVERSGLSQRFPFVQHLAVHVSVRTIHPVEKGLTVYKQRQMDRWRYRGDPINSIRKSLRSLRELSLKRELGCRLKLGNNTTLGHRTNNCLSNDF